MKKTYIIPSVEVIKIETQTMLAVSGVPGITDQPWMPGNPLLSPEQELLNLPGIGDQFNFLKLPE
jgi:hypothetical protein